MAMRAGEGATRRRGALAPLLTLCVGVLLAGLALWASDFRYLQRAPLTPPFAPVSGHAFEAAIEWEGPAEGESPWNSSVALYEDQRPLGPGRVPADYVAEFGGGAYAHLGRRLIFSTSDNSDPAANGRSYQVERPVALPTVLLFALALLPLIALCVLWHQLHQRLPAGARRRVLDIVMPVIFTALCVETLSGAMLTASIADKPLLQRLHDHVFRDVPPEPGFGSFIYAPHHYLFYSLNPESAQPGTNRFDPLYLIRRTEPIRPRSEVAFRILVVGGSTTYDTRIADERKTWVHRLESLLRQRFGNGYDVINGGVGGYTIYENFIHYITLLSSLEPDLVLFFEGINDVHPRLFGDIAPDYRNYNLPGWREEGADLKRDTSALRGLAAYRLLMMKLRYRAFITEGIGKLARRPYPPPEEWSAALDRNPPVIYRRALEAFLDMLRGQGRKAAILPQYFLARDDDDEIFVRGVRENNVVNRQVAEARSLPYLAALEQNPPFLPQDLYDNVHFTESGAEKMANLVFRFLQENGLVPGQHASQ